MTSLLTQAVAELIETATGETFQADRCDEIGGGCINRALRLGGSGRRYFVKINDAELLPMFEDEVDGLQALAATDTLRVPRPIGSGSTAEHAFLVMEYIELGGHGDAVRCGRQLAALHRTGHECFGWARDNVIGASPQPNGWHADWITFWRDRRLGHQLQLAAEQGYHGKLQRRGERLLVEFPALIDHAPQASLLHGDLWGGNISYDSQRRPVIYDPAVYFGDRECDLAMTELFGGPGAGFRAAYHEAWPLASGYRVRKTLYNLYHILNHLNLFGGGYARQSLQMIDQLLAEAGH